LFIEPPSNGSIWQRNHFRLTWELLGFIEVELSVRTEEHPMIVPLLSAFWRLTDLDAFTKINEALKQQADRLIDLQFDLFALAAAIKNQRVTDQARLEQDFRAVRLVLGKGRPLPESSERLIRLLLVHDAAENRGPMIDIIGELGLEKEPSVRRKDQPSSLRSRQKAVG
jgi:hypothetical protein